MRDGVQITFKIPITFCRLVLHIPSFLLNDTHREKAPSNKTPALTKSRNIGI